MRTVTFTFEHEHRTITEEDARWPLWQLRSAPVLTEAASSAAAKLELIDRVYETDEQHVEGLRSLDEIQS